MKTKRVFIVIDMIQGEEQELLDVIRTETMRNCEIISKPTDEQIYQSGINNVHTTERDLAVYCVGYKNCLTELFGK